MRAALNSYAFAIDARAFDVTNGQRIALRITAWRECPRIMTDSFQNMTMCCA
jgi:hypothetical protein